MNASRHRNRRLLLVGWTAVFVACATAVAFKLWQNHAVDARYQTALAARQAEEEEHQRAGRAKALAAPSPVVAAFDAAQRDLAAGRRPAPTTRDVAKLFNAGLPIGDATPGPWTWYWRDANTLFVWELQFRGDLWVGYAEKGVDVRLNPWAPPPPPPFYDDVERAAHAILLHGRLAGLWVGLATLLTLRIRQAAPLAHVLLAIAVVCLLAGVMPLKNSALADTRSFMERLPGILLMAGVALVAMWIHHRLARARACDGPTCDSCGYSLTGNISGVCPECGTAITPIRPTAVE